MSTAIENVYYDSSTKIGLKFKRRFWEQDDQIYGGISYTNLPISIISYPSTDFFSDGPGVLLGCYGVWRDMETYYPLATKMDQNTFMAGEHISYLPAWQEGANLPARSAMIVEQLVNPNWLVEIKVTAVRP
jgi:monoamine oxidase